MKRILTASLIFILAILLTACGGSHVKGNGKIITQSRQVDPFNSVHIGGRYVLQVEAGKQQSLAIITDSNIASHIATQVKDGVLFIRSKKGYQLNPSQPIVVDVTLPEIKGIHVDGASQVKVAGISSKVFTYRSSGTSKAELSGQADLLSIHLSGTGQVNAANLKANDVAVVTSGTSNVRVHAVKELHVKISGTGAVIYSGSPEIIKESISGTGTVRKASSKSE